MLLVSRYYYIYVCSGLCRVKWHIRIVVIPASSDLDTNMKLDMRHLHKIVSYARRAKHVENSLHRIRMPHRGGCSKFAEMQN